MAEDIDSEQQEAQSNTSSGTGAGTGNARQMATSSGSAGDASRDQSQSTGPVGSGNYEVQQGDCIESIAYEHGFAWETIWNDSHNAALKNNRGDPNALLPGDRLYMRPKREKHSPGATEVHHRFRRRGVPSVLRIRVLDDEDRPRCGEAYLLEIDGKVEKGELDSDGRLTQSIPPNAKSGKLIVGDGESQTEYDLKLGHIDPVSEISGVQGRLNNLGFFCGEADGALNPQTRAALMKFQRTHDLTPTGEPDQITQHKLREAHGC